MHLFDTGSKRLRLDQSRREMETGSCCPGYQPCGNLREMVAAGEQVCRRKWESYGRCLLLRLGQWLVDKQENQETNQIHCELVSKTVMITINTGRLSPVAHHNATRQN